MSAAAPSSGASPGLKVLLRPTGAAARVGRIGFPHVTSATGGEIDIVTGAAQPGFNPIDLLYASLAACLVLSARIAASRMGLLDRITGIGADVTGEKTAQEPYRIARFDVVFTISGNLDAGTRRQLVEEAEAICTVSNTLRNDADFTLRIADEG